MTTMEEGTVPPIRFWRCHEKERAASGEESRRGAASATAPNRGREPRRRCWRCAAKLLPPENIAALPGSTTATVRVPWKEDELGVVAPCLCCRRAPLNPLAWVEYRCLHVIFGVFSYFVLLFQMIELRFAASIDRGPRERTFL